MALAVKIWEDLPARTTPINAAALQDLETRLGAYTDAHSQAGTASVTAGSWSSSGAVGGQTFSYKDVAVVFAHVFDVAPTVVMTLTSATTFSGGVWPVAITVTTTGFTARFVTLRSDAPAASAYWMAR